MNRQQVIQEFFNWLFEESVILEKEIDFTLCSRYEDPHIYIPEKLNLLFKSTAMQRIERVSQLATSIRFFPNVYYSRLEHSKGVYNQKLELILEKWKNPNWKEYIENNNLKLELLAELIKSATHDIGHLPLSHVMEILIINSRDFHEDIGKRIVLEDKELNKIFNDIDSKLLEAIKKVYSNDVFGFKEHDESNYDIDRLDYIQRDTMYQGKPIYFIHESYSTLYANIDDNSEIIYNLDGSLKISKSRTENNIPIDIYEYDSLNNIELFLNTRISQYENTYFSKQIQASDSLVGIFVNELLESKDASGKELTDFINHIKSNSIGNISIEEYIKWNDIEFWKSVIYIAEHTQNYKLKHLALLIIPDLKALMKLTFEFLNCKEGKKTRYANYSESDKQFIRKLHTLIYSDSDISQILKDADYFKKNVILFKKENINEVKEIIGDSLITHSALIKGYKSSEPIYIKDKYERVFELSKHPERSREWDNCQSKIDTQFAILPLIEKNKIPSLSPYKEDCCINIFNQVNMSPIQTQNTLEEYFEI